MNKNEMEGDWDTKAESEMFSTASQAPPWTSLAGAGMF